VASNEKCRFSGTFGSKNDSAKNIVEARPHTPAASLWCIPGRIFNNMVQCYLTEIVAPARLVSSLSLHCLLKKWFYISLHILKHLFTWEM
jgi:hypothetical protein